MLCLEEACDSHSSCLLINFPQGKAQHMQSDIGRLQQMAEWLWSCGGGGVGGWGLSYLRAVAKASGFLCGSSPPHPQEPSSLSRGGPSLSSVLLLLEAPCRVPSAAVAWNSLFLSLGLSLVHEFFF